MVRLQRSSARSFRNAPLTEKRPAPNGYAQPVYPKAMLARLAAGRGIDLHTDGGPVNPLVHKIHVPPIVASFLRRRLLISYS